MRKPKFLTMRLLKAIDACDDAQEWLAKLPGKRLELTPRACAAAAKGMEAAWIDYLAYCLTIDVRTVIPRSENSGELYRAFVKDTYDLSDWFYKSIPERKTIARRAFFKLYKQLPEQL